MSAPTRPSAGPARAWHFPEVTRRTLSNGAALLVARAPRLPLVTVLALLDAGAATDPAGQEGVAMLTARALTEGTARRDGAAMALAAEECGTSLEAHADWDGAYLGFTVQRERLSAMLSLFAEVVATPTFPAHEVARLRAERLADIAHEESEPQGLADLRFAQQAYRPGSRYALPDGGTRATVGALDHAACAAFHAARWRPGGATLVVTGDITPDEAQAALEAALADWHGAAPAPVAVDDRPVEAGRAVHLVARPGAPQSELRVGHVAVPRAHPDFFPLTLMNAILGGLFNSRVNLNLREAHGYTYGASTGFDWRRAAGPFVASSAVQTEVTRPALEEILAELTRIRTEPVSAEELSLAQRYLAGVFPLRYESTSSLASALAAMVAYGLPADYFETYRDRIRAVTIEQVLDVAQRHLHLDRLQVVLVGDPAAVEGPLRDWGFGPVTVRPADGA